ncbi:MAG: alcohol dehydrogenase catalytic domain-containing protein [Gracilibacteraceae bacterium]|nr:alcohol dehydrogenase catalytic domain-containing protein [Gracilibacteraceae bacterium]
MKAVRIEGVKRVGVADVPVPNTDGGKKALIKVAYAGICASDMTTWFRGSPAITLGHEFSGTIVDPGNSMEFKKGDRVTASEINSCFECDSCRRGYPNLCSQVFATATGIMTDGGIAEYVAVPTNMLFKLPDNVSFLEGALVEPAAVALRGLHLAGFKAGDKVLVTGCGPIGIFAAANAKALGASYVAMTEVSEERMAFPRSLPYVDGLFNALDPELDKKLKDASETGFDVAIEATGFTAATQTAIRALRVGGHLGILGVHERDMVFNIPQLMFKSIKISGDFYSLPSDFEEVISLMASGKLDIKNCATSIIPFADAQKQFETNAAGKSLDIKVILDPSS